MTQRNYCTYNLNVANVDIVGIVANTEVEDIKRLTIQVNDKRYSLSIPWKLNSDYSNSINGINVINDINDILYTQ